MKKNIFHFGVFIVLILYYFIVKFTGFYIPCPIHKITGLYCPGCGVSRMLISLVHLDFYKAFMSNQLLFISLPVFCFLYLDTIINNFRDKKPLYKKIPNMYYYIYIGLLLLFMVLRNIFPILAPIHI